jgi:hypothetical protein
MIKSAIFHKEERTHLLKEMVDAEKSIKIKN